MNTSFSRPRRELADVLGWMLAASSRLTHVQVDLQMVHSDVVYDLVMPAPPLPLPWPYIQVLHLQDRTLPAITLTHFLSASTRTLTALHLDRMHLCSTSVGDWPGTRIPYSWASVLDRLRSHALGSGRGLIIQLRRPRGAEFEDRLVSDTDMAHLKALFEPDDSGLSAVDRFIQGLTDRNPLVEAGKTPLLYPRPRGLEG